MTYSLEFFEDDNGRQPVLDWLREELSRSDRFTVGTAMREILERLGIDVCGTPFGKQVGDGLFEFRLREEGLLVRVFCHALWRSRHPAPWRVRQGPRSIETSASQGNRNRPRAPRAVAGEPPRLISLLTS